jgi:ubiquinone biosynthesis protein COQ9
MLELDNRLNELLGTKAYTLPTRKKQHIKIKQVKQKAIKQPKQKTKKAKVIKEAQRKKKVKSFLQQRIEEAKQNARYSN